jgi:glycosyltransferase involved in cell wall biosynthesis
MNDDRPTLLLLNLYMVHPPNSGAKVVLCNRIAELSKSFRVTFCCLGESESDAEGAAALGDLAEVVVARGAWRDRGWLERALGLLRDPCATEFADKLEAWFGSEDLQTLLRRRFAVVEVHSPCWYRTALRSVPGLWVLVAHNREVEYFVARARAAWGLSRWRFALRAWLDAALVAWQERRAIARADAVVSLAPLSPGQRRRWFGDRPVLCNWGGIDLDFYRADEVEDGGVGRPPVLAFVAAFFVEAAAEAAACFVAEALPAIARIHPDVRLRLVGDHRDHPTIVRLARENPAIEATGLVEDVRPYLAHADVVLAPIVGGSGVRYKIMEALAAGRPLVATHKAAEGLGLLHETDALLSDDVAGMAPLVLRVLGDESLRDSLSRNGLATAEEEFDRVALHRELADWYRAQLGAKASRV